MRLGWILVQRFHRHLVAGHRLGLLLVFGHQLEHLGLGHLQVFASVHFGRPEVLDRLLVESFAAGYLNCQNLCPRQVLLEVHLAAHFVRFDPLGHLELHLKAPLVEFAHLCFEQRRHFHLL